VHSRGTLLRSRADYLLIEATSAADHALLKSARDLFGAQLAWLAAFQGMELAATASQRVCHSTNDTYIVTFQCELHHYAFLGNGHEEETSTIQTVHIKMQ
jgi:hypothetical protein